VPAKKVVMWVLVGWLLSVVVSPRGLVAMVRGGSSG
jgi:hypothetical protein